MVVGILTTLPAVAVTPGTHSGAPFGVPDGNPIGGFSDLTINGAGTIITELQVNLHISGGYNGDLYAYLSYGGKLLPLLNRIGVAAGSPFGHSGAGMQITFADSAAVNVHAAVDGYLTGSYRPDGQETDPLSPANLFNAMGGERTLMGQFGGMNPNGTWALFVADVVTGGGPCVVNEWSLTIQTVPEPNIASLLIAGLAVAIRARDRTATKSRSQD